MTFSLKEKLLKDYSPNHRFPEINGERIANRLDQISKIGLTELYGSNRPGFSKAEREAKALIMGWMKEAGMLIHYDGANNLIGRVAGKNPKLPAIVSGSHVDSVPDGGHFDGVLGVILALEVASSWYEAGFIPEKPYEVVVFSDEEGARFNGGLNGSEAFAGIGNLKEKLKLTDTAGMTFTEVLEDAGSSFTAYKEAKRHKEEIEMFVEVHIEQGKRLEKANLACGIVTGIAGATWLEVTFTGEAGHAGNTPMNDRRDPMLAVSDFMLMINKIPGKISNSAVVTVGKLDVLPNGVNVIPAQVKLYVDIRDIYQETCDEIVGKVMEAAEKSAEKFNVLVEQSSTMGTAPVLISEKYQAKFAKLLEEIGIKPYYLPSGAGHDAMIIGAHWDIAMLFVRSKAWISHNPAEWTDLADIVIAAHVLKQFIERSQ